MSSYTKQMIETAQMWLKANPDPGEPFLNIPGPESADRTRPKALANRQRIDALLRDEKTGKLSKEEADKLRGLLKELDEKEAEVDSTNMLMQRALNKTMVVGNDKFTTDHTKAADGRTGAMAPHLGRWALAWARHGYNVFDLSADFCASMLLTDARALDISDVKLPFGGILLMIPDGFARGVEGGHYTKIHIAEIHRSHLTMLSVANRVVDLLDEAKAAGSDTNALLDELENLRENHPLLTGVPEDCERSDKARADSTDTAIQIYATDGHNVLETLIERKGLTWDAFEELPLHSQGWSGDGVPAQNDDDIRRTIRQIVFGMLAYVSAVERSIEEQPAAKRKKGAPSKEVEAKRWSVGRTIRISPHLVKAARSGSREIALRLKHRHIVRGHYRNQAHGIRMRDRKTIWVEPYWKGPEDGAALVHTYVLEKQTP